MSIFESVASDAVRSYVVGSNILLELNVAKDLPWRLVANFIML